MSKQVRFVDDEPSAARSSIPSVAIFAEAPMDVDQPTSSASAIPQKISRSADFFRVPLVSSVPSNLENQPIRPAFPVGKSQHFFRSFTKPPDSPRKIFSEPFLPPPPPSQSFSFGGNQPHASVESAAFLRPSSQRRRAADFFKSVQPAPVTADNSEFVTANHPPSTASQPPSLLPTSTPTPPISRPTIKLPARAQSQGHTKTPPIGINPHKTTTDRPKFVFNTDDLATRQMQHSWRGHRQAAGINLSRDDLHADQVDCDRALPMEMDDHWYPSFAISPADLHSLHGYLLTRYDIESFDDYTHLLALFRNTRAIEAHNARQRYTELSEASASLEKLHGSLIQRLHDRHSKR